MPFKSAEAMVKQYNTLFIMALMLLGLASCKQAKKLNPFEIKNPKDRTIAKV